MTHLTMPDWLPGETGPPVPSWEAHTDPNRVESEQTDTTRTGTVRRGTAVAARGSRSLQGNREMPYAPDENRLRGHGTARPNGTRDREHRNGESGSTPFDAIGY